MNDLESAITATRRVELRACTADACHQDSRRCPCPSECSIPEDDEAAFFKDLGTAGIACLIVVILIAVTVAAV